ncbi:MAG TPA: lanthionine synthetase C family protein, partial [Longimicrobium sp.]|nr:lanthionine synthetase C family protein [Longimicrobium sp.]
AERPPMDHALRPDLQADSTWPPLADGDLRERAWDAVHTVAAELATLLPGAGSAGGAGLGAGDAGVALFFHSLHAATGDDDHAAAARTLLDRAIGAIQLPEPSLELYRGALGVAWTLAHLRARGAADDGEGVLAAVDQAVLAALRAEPAPAAFDLVRGAAGLGVYALERVPAPAAAVEALDAVVERLERAAERSGEGAAWFTAPAALHPWQRARLPRGVYDLGMAHGAAGVIALLARVVDAGVAARRARDLLDGAVRWLRAREMPAGSLSRYPGTIAPGHAPGPARLAWCYGDPGVGIALLAAARALGSAELEAHARSVLRDAAARAPEGSGVADAPFCHGAAGLAHLFHRAWRATGEAALRDAALRWLRAALDLPVPEGSRSRFPFRAPGGRDAAWLDRPGLLEGAAGVGLVLLAAVSPVPPAWDRVFLADVGAVRP